MKEATGELNLTVITVVAIAAIAALVTIFIYPQIQANIMISTACTNLDAKGNYTSLDDNGTASNNNVSCTNFNCTAKYNGHTYTRTCSGA